MSRVTPSSAKLYTCVQDLGDQKRPYKHLSCVVSHKLTCQPLHPCTLWWINQTAAPLSRGHASPGCLQPWHWDNSAHPSMLVSMVLGAPACSSGRKGRPRAGMPAESAQCLGWVRKVQGWAQRWITLLECLLRRGRAHTHIHAVGCQLWLLPPPC